MTSSIVLDSSNNSHPSTYDRSGSIKTSLSSQYSLINSAWNVNRNIWRSNGSTGNSEDSNVQNNRNDRHPFHDNNGQIQGASIRDAPASANQLGRPQPPSSIPIGNSPHPTQPTDASWLSSTTMSSNNKHPTLISPSKPKETGWLFRDDGFDLQKFSLLTGSAPDNDVNRNRPAQGGVGAIHHSQNSSFQGLEEPSFLMPTSRLSAQDSSGPPINVGYMGQNFTDLGYSESAMSSSYDQNGNQAKSTTVSPTTKRFGNGTSFGASYANESPKVIRNQGQYSVRNTSSTQRWRSQTPQLELVDSSHFSNLKMRNNPSGLRQNSHQMRPGGYNLNQNHGIPQSGEALDGEDLNGNRDNQSFTGADAEVMQKSVWPSVDFDAHQSYPTDWRPNFRSPHYSAGATPPTGPESIRSAGGSGISSRTSHHDIALVDRKLKNLDLYQQPSFFPPQNFVPAQGFDLQQSSIRMNPLATPYTVQGPTGLDGYTTNVRISVREPEHAQAIRSPLLEEFRINNKTSRRYELRDIFNHIVEFSGDQHGSRFIQQKLETANSDEKDQVFKEIQPNSLQLMTDVFGNYVIQKLFEHGNQSQKKALANQMKGQVLNLSLQMYGCRVVQKALEHVLTDQQASLVKELNGPNKQILKAIRDQNGNHVVQKAIERVPAEHIQFIVEAHKGEVVKLATHTYGCRVIQRILEHCQPPAKRIILDELHGCVAPLITDSFGNYVVQHVIQNGEPDDRRRVVAIVQQQLLIFSKHKFASNVVEKCIEYADDDQRGEIVRRLIGHNDQGQTPVLGLLRDQYGNYVIQKIHKLLRGSELEALTKEMKACFPQLKRTSYGKQVLAIEKLLYGSCFSYDSISGGVQPSVGQGTDYSTAAGGGNLHPNTFDFQQSSTAPAQVGLPLQMTTYY